MTGADAPAPDHPTPPVAFLSHASEDKTAFVEPLAHELARLGVRGWLDKWEIQPGDSLMQRLFDEGIAVADAVVIVVSSHSVGKPWVREELDASAVRRITEGTRLIPVRLDDVDVPAPLRHLAWLNAERSPVSVSRVAAAIASLLFGHDPRPSVAPAPTYTRMADTLPGLSAGDATLLVETVREAMSGDLLIALNWHEVQARAEAAGLTGEALWESLEAIAEADLVDVESGPDHHVHRYDLTRFGYAAGIGALVPNIADAERAVIAALVNAAPTSNTVIHDLAELCGLPVLVVDQVLRELEDRDLIALSRTILVGGPPPSWRTRLRATGPLPFPYAAGFLVLLAVVMLASAGGIDRYQRDILTTLLLYVALAQSWNILSGFGGQISLGISGFVGTGAYVTGLLLLHTGVGYLATVAASAVLGAMLAAILAFPLLRLRGDYFAIGSLAAALALQAIARNWSYAGGSTGLNLPIDETPMPDVLLNVAIVVAALGVLAALVVQRSPFGLRLMAVRDNEPAAVGLGVSSFGHKAAALIISGALSGLVGSVVALQQIAFEPGGAFSITWTLNALLMTVVGGIATVVGPVVGTVIIYYGLTKQLASYQTLGLVIEGGLLIAVVRLAPQGLWPLATGLARRLVLGREAPK